MFTLASTATTRSSQPASTNTPPTWLRWACGALVFLFPVTALGASNFGSVLFFILALLGMGAAFRPAVRRPLPDEIKWVFYAVGVFFLLALISYFAVDYLDDTALKKLGRYARFLLAIPIYYIVRYAGVSRTVVWSSFVCAAIVSGLVAIDQEWLHVLFKGEEDRARGTVHPIIFGDMSVLLAILSLASTGFFWRKHRAIAALSLIGFLLGLTGSFLSQSRGGWVVFPAILLLFIWYGRRHFPRWQTYAVIACLIALPSIAYVVPQTHVKERIDIAISEVNGYYAGDVDTSVGLRLEFWKTAWLVFRDHPIFGAGMGGYVRAKEALVTSGQVSAYVEEYDHPHNEYLAALATRGIVGLATLLILFAIPARVFIHHAQSTDRDDSLYGFAGLLFIVAFAHFALSGDTFDRALPITFFAYYLATLCALLRPNSSTTATG